MDWLEQCGCKVEAAESYTQAQLTTNWSKTPFSPAAQMAPAIQSAWDGAQKDAERRGATLFNGPLARLMGFEKRGGSLHIWAQPTCYRDFVGTNLADPALPAHQRSEPIGVSALIISEDNRVIIGKRGTKVFGHPGHIHCLGGHAEPKHFEESESNPLFDAIEDEITEELNVTKAQIEHTTCLALIRDNRTAQPELLFVTHAKKRAPHLAAANNEHTELISLPNDPKALERFQAQNASRIVPVARAALALFRRKNAAKKAYDHP